MIKKKEYNSTARRYEKLRSLLEEIEVQMCQSCEGFKTINIVDNIVASVDLCNKEKIEKIVEAIKSFRETRNAE